MTEAQIIRRILVQIAVVISLVEIAIMLVFAVIPHALSPTAEAVVDAFCLVVISTPIIYVWVIKPFIVARDEATHLAQRDHLTLVSNRLFLAEHVKRCSEACARWGTYAALLYIDLDGFKRINDGHGHAAGDAVLIEAAKRMRSVSRQQDAIFRLGGDEFMILVCPLEANAESVVDTARKVAEKFRAVLREPFVFDGKVLQVDVSIGLRLIDGRRPDADAVIREADAAMYQAKLSGGGRILVFDA
jgi:diguanylate cyclase (GGDEF)-like protein